MLGSSSDEEQEGSPEAKLGVTGRSSQTDQGLTLPCHIEVLPSPRGNEYELWKNALETSRNKGEFLYPEE